MVQTVRANLASSMTQPLYVHLAILLALLALQLQPPAQIVTLLITIGNLMLPTVYVKQGSMTMEQLSVIHVLTNALPVPLRALHVELVRQVQL